MKVIDMIKILQTLPENANVAFASDLNGNPYYFHSIQDYGTHCAVENPEYNPENWEDGASEFVYPSAITGDEKNDNDDVNVVVFYGDGLIRI